MTVIDYAKVKKEWVFFLRNNDIFSITVRNVTTTTDTGTFSSTTSKLLNVPNVKNIRSIVVASVTLSYGKDYDVDIDYDDNGTRKCNITFTTAQTGSYTITYDYGSDKIFPDYPEDFLTIDSFPRIGTDLLSMPTNPAGFGNVTDTKNSFTTIIYSKNTMDLANYITLIRTAVRDNYKNFYYLGKYVTIKNVGPVLPAPRELGKKKIYQQNIDIDGYFNYEK